MTMKYDLPVSSIVTIGTEFGVLHMISGIDHFGALIVFLSMIDWNAIKTAACWAFGHSVGVATIAWLQTFFSTSHLRFTESICKFLAGLALLSLGILAAIFHRTLHHSDDGDGHRLETTIQEREDEEEEEEEVHKERSLLFSSNKTKDIDDNVSKPATFCRSFRMKMARKEREWWRSILLNQKLQIIYRVLIWSYGLIQGLADSVGLLGTLPSMILADLYYSTIYIAVFCIAGILMAIATAILYAHMVLRDRKRYENRECRIECIAAFLCTIMGLFFLYKSICTLSTYDPEI